MRNVAALILCAGQSIRTGDEIKPLMKWKDGRTFIERALGALSEVKSSLPVLREILFVTGSHAQQIEPEITKLGARFVFNPYFERGMHSSICEGLKGLTSSWDGALIGLVDQPQLESEDYALLIREFCNSRLNLTRPEFQGEIGNPAIIGRKYFLEVLCETDTDRGCYYLFQRHPQDVLTVAMPNNRCTLDIDTREELSEASRK